MNHDDVERELTELKIALSKTIEAIRELSRMVRALKSGKEAEFNQSLEAEVWLLHSAEAHIL